MMASIAAARLIMELEGFRACAYPDEGGTWTIGYGSTEGVREGMQINQESACCLLERDLERVSREVSRLVKVPLTQNQHDALCSFVYNVGAAKFAKSTLLRILNEGKALAVPAQMERWVYVRKNGRLFRSNGLAHRRLKEAELFAKHS